MGSAALGNRPSREGGRGEISDVAFAVVGLCSTLGFLSVPDEYAESVGGVSVDLFWVSSMSRIGGICFMRFESRRAKPVLFRRVSKV